MIKLYKANNWSTADKPDKLFSELINSHTLVTARILGDLVGVGYAISDDSVVVYYPHMLVQPDFHRKGIGEKMIKELVKKHKGFHQ